ncbi:MAG: hypothetical protein AAB542_03185 [Patescibacteria group bacterium]
MSDIDVIPEITETEWHAFERKVAMVAPYVSWIHLNVSDGTIAAATLTDFSGLSALIAQYPRVSFEARLLVASPEKYVRQLTDAGCKRLIAHVESNDPRMFLEAAKFDEIEVGIALDGATEIDQVEPFLEEIDCVVVMTAEAGSVGGTFLPEAVEKIRLIRQNFPDLPIEAVGAINETTMRVVKDAGATRVVSNSFLFSDETDIASRIELLKSL